MSNVPNPPRLDPVVSDALRGVDWEWRNGGKHWKIFADGQLVTIMSRGSHRDHMLVKVVRDVRKWRRRQA